MITTKRGIVLGLTLLTVLCSVGLMLIAPPAPSLAAPSRLPARDTPTPVPPRSSDTHGADVLVGWIELYAQPARAGLRATVQWQDGSGAWHDVDGWKGSADSGFQSWGVFPSEFGRGPFRWVLSNGGQVVGQSAPFNLPSHPRETVTIRVSLAP